MHKTRRVLILIALLCGVLMLPAPAEASHQPALPLEGNVRFKTPCNFDHAANDDPIVFPDVDGAAHRHNFFGRVDIQETTDTYAEYVGFPTTCRDSANSSGYWTPAVLNTGNGTWVTPQGSTSYYRRGQKRGTIQPMPAGLKMLAGSPVLFDPDGERVSGWQCGNGDPAPRPVSGTCGDIKMVVDFPDCWDGVNLDSLDHRSHMAYAVWDHVDQEAQVCPSTHPVPVPALTTYVNFAQTNWAIFDELSSGHIDDELHGDFFMGWTEVRMADRVTNCLNAFVAC
jgi:hypothetical protein